ncbi:ATP-dependent helicase [Clostridium sp. AF32-12BH]|uniref:ATP-dependent helicase n=1 Tax=Clostridium sp. AF32-12BH TaxID=2292006 RepID=UPI000E47C6F3|nr:ATP-dependent helicase [Clostridium sp. AF32-12BH]RHP47951.1 ATP-dependent helicase [Clostridium sp. AF32-12BH]
MAFHESQLQAIHHRQGPMMVLAGPGSGKTTVITHRVKYLVEECSVEPGSILVITFTKAAAQEMRQRFEKLTEGRRLPVSFGTFHAVFFAILKRAYRYDASNIARDEQRTAIIRELVDRYQMDVEDEAEFIAQILSEISLVKGEMMNLDYYYSKNCSEEMFKKLYQGYEKAMVEKSLLDFDDMLVLCYELFTQRKDILEAWQRKYQYILIDEFQDINRVQYEIIRMLAAPQNNLFIVGDDDQSIYRFRGAKPEIMLGFEKDYPQAKRVLLGINYRSTSNIVDYAGCLIRHNKTRFEKEIRAARGAGRPVTTVGFADAPTETRTIIKEIQDYVQMGYRLSDIAVLYRTSMEPRLLMERLMEYNIPFQMRDALPNIYEHWITQDLLTYIRIAADPLAEKHQAKRADALRIINRPKRYISREALDGQIVSWDQVKSWYRSKDWMVERIEDLEYDLKILKKLAPVAAVNYIRKAIGYDEYLKDYAEYRRMKPEELLELADQIQESASGYKTIDAWLLHMEEYGEQLKQQAQNWEVRDQDCVALMTMHSAKGLEFPIVYIMDANERVTPHHKAVLDADLEEERRMFYVAMTRAKDRLHVYYTKERYGKPQERSRFIDEYLYPDSAPPGEFRPGPEVKTKGMLESCRATSQQKTAAKTERPAMQQSAGTKPVRNGKVVR